jgi:hypothetical protein
MAKHNAPSDDSNELEAVAISTALAFTAAHFGQFLKESKALALLAGDEPLSELEALTLLLVIRRLASMEAVVVMGGDDKANPA